MERITAELREYFGDCYLFRYGDVRERLTAIADRIDEAHEALRDQLDTSERQKESYREDLTAANWRVHAAYNDGFDDGSASADDWLAQHEDELAEHGWVKLPVDADGVPIHAGDVMEHRRRCVKSPATVDHMELWEDGGHYFWTIKLDTDDESHGFSGCELRHYHAPTVEDVLRELLSKYDELRLCPSAFDPFELMAEYAKKLRLAGDE